MFAHLNMSWMRYGHLLHLCVCRIHVFAGILEIAVVLFHLSIWSHIQLIALSNFDTLEVQTILKTNVTDIFKNNLTTQIRASLNLLHESET